jgi:hypothetical protein
MCTYRNIKYMETKNMKDYTWGEKVAVLLVEENIGEANKNFVVPAVIIDNTAQNHVIVAMCHNDGRWRFKFKYYKVELASSVAAVVNHVNSGNNHFTVVEQIISDVLCERYTELSFTNLALRDLILTCQFPKEPSKDPFKETSALAVTLKAEHNRTLSLPLYQSTTLGISVTDNLETIYEYISSIIIGYMKTILAAYASKNEPIGGLNVNLQHLLLESNKEDYARILQKACRDDERYADINRLNGELFSSLRERITNGYADLRIEIIGDQVDLELIL